MSGSVRLIPSSSQTVGPYFRIGLEHLIGRSTIHPEDHAAITIHCRVLDRDRAPVPDAMLEFWTPGELRKDSNDTPTTGAFIRVATDMDGSFSALFPRPAPVPFNETTIQAPHLIVLVFARGLLRHLIARVYFGDDPGISTDPVLLAVPSERRRTLIAQRERERSYLWDVILQGNDETVFFAW